MMPTRRNYNQNCPIARGLDVLGERWTLLILRELVGRTAPLRRPARRAARHRNQSARRATQRATRRRARRPRRLTGPDRRAPSTRLSDMGWQRVLPILQSIAWFGLDRLDPIDDGPVSPLNGFLAGILLGFNPAERGRAGGDIPRRDRRPPFRVRGNAGPSGRRSRRAFGDGHRQRGGSRHRPPGSKRSQAQGGAAAHQLRRRPACRRRTAHAFSLSADCQVDVAR